MACNGRLKGVWRGVLACALVVLLGPPCGCSGFGVAPRPPAPCDLESLLIDDTLLPEGWEKPGSQGARVGRASFAVDWIGTCYSSRTQGGACHVVQQAADVREAGEGYGEFQMGFNLLGRGTTGWTRLRDVGYESSVADRYRVACKTHVATGYEQCLFVARYDVYVVEFEALISADGMTRADVEAVLADIDRRMAACLE
jgi:hypothetical protein